MKEQEICLKCLDFENYVISLGGGSVMNSKIREKIKRATKKIAIHKNSIKHYQGRKSGRIKALDYTRKFR